MLFTNKPLWEEPPNQLLMELCSAMLPVLLLMNWLKKFLKDKALLNSPLKSMKNAWMLWKLSEKDNSISPFPKFKILLLPDNKMDTEISWLTNPLLFTLMLTRLLLVQTKKKIRFKECPIKPEDILFLTLGIQLSLDLNYLVINSKRNLNWEPLQKPLNKLKKPMMPLP